MFTGIVEQEGLVKAVIHDGNNIHFWIESAIAHKLKIDQSVAHDGVCLTVTHLDAGQHRVTAIHETLEKTALRHWDSGRVVNLERCLRLDQRLDGHLVQGHVDAVGYCHKIEDEGGSWRFTFTIDPEFAVNLVNKGSVCINGVSLTVIDPGAKDFQVAIIPFTYEHTNFKQVQLGDAVNLEFDIVGKYILRNLQLSSPNS